MTPRCGRPLALDGRFERAGEPGDPGNPPRCGRPARHNGPHRSARAVERYLIADAERWGDHGRAQRNRRRAEAAGRRCFECGYLATAPGHLDACAPQRPGAAA